MRKRKLRSQKVNNFCALIFIAVFYSCDNHTENYAENIMLKIISIQCNTSEGQSSEPISYTSFQIRMYNRSCNEFKLPIDSISREYSSDNFLLIKKEPVCILPLKFDGCSQDTKETTGRKTIISEENITLAPKDSIDLFFSNDQDQIRAILASPNINKQDTVSWYSNYMKDIFRNKYILILKLEKLDVLIEKNDDAKIKSTFR